MERIKCHFLIVVFLCSIILSGCDSSGDKMLREFLLQSGFDDYEILYSSDACGSMIDPCVEAIVRNNGEVSGGGMLLVENDEKAYLERRAIKFDRSGKFISGGRAVQGLFEDGLICSNNCESALLRSGNTDLYYVFVYKL